MWTIDQKNPTWNLNCEQKGRRVQGNIKRGDVLDKGLEKTQKIASL